MQTYRVCEYGLVRKASDFSTAPGSNFSENTAYLPDRAFDSLLNFILDNQTQDTKEDFPFIVFRKNTRHQIKVRNYVGVIEAKDGTSLEILPKIYSHRNDLPLESVKEIFIKMLMRLRNAPFKKLRNAHLYVKRDFPILEVFVDSFIEECEALLNSDLRRGYISEEENLNVLRGKLLVSSNIKSNTCTKTRFYCSHEDFTLNIPQNRLIKSTLMKLYDSTRSHSNLVALKVLINRMEGVDPSLSINEHLRISKIKNRLFFKYESLVQWAEVFLFNKSFTNFSGSSINSAVLFPMEKVFEDYVISLFRQHAPGYKVKAQDRSYFLVEKHLDRGAFRLIPDIFMENEGIDRIIIDTKWKLLDENAPRLNYQIKSSDMYQLYAYGRKYSVNSKFPKLALIYPSTPKFRSKLGSFIYEGDLALEVLPLDLTENAGKEIRRILQSV